MYYKNLSNTVKTFYGVTFEPNEIKEVPGYINHPKFLITDKPIHKEPPKDVIKKADEKQSDKQVLKDNKVSVKQILNQEEEIPNGEHNNK